MNQFLTDILTSDYFMRALQQYGVGHGQLLNHTVIPRDRGNPPRGTELTSESIERYLSDWIRDGTVADRPLPDESNLLYVLFTPQTTNLGKDDGTDPQCIGGNHDSGQYINSRGGDNLFWAAVQEWHHAGERLPRTAREFVDSCSWLVSHELVEAFTNRDGHGYQTADGGEIGDICECARGSETQKAPIIKAEVCVNGRVWYVEPYWDNENQSCYPLHIVPRNRAPFQYYELPEPEQS
jgi:hypothetical protein